MATKTDSKNTHKADSTTNDWDDEDDNWENWDDAEDNLEETTTPKDSKPTVDVPNNNNNRDRETNKSDTQANNESKGMTTQQQQQQSETANTWGVGSLWGAVVSTATTVSQGLNQVIGVPDPEEMARLNTQENRIKSEQQRQQERLEKYEEAQKQSAAGVGAPMFGLDLVTSIGSKVINTGLDTLEGIGKKTMDILQENDPLLKKKRKMLGLESDKPNLSEILKEAKNDAEQVESRLQQLKLEKTKEMLRFEVLFENNCGLVHLEALEILSKESTLKLQTLQDAVSGNALTELKETINEVKELLELEDLGEGESDGDYDADKLSELLTTSIEDAGVEITFDDIVNKWSEALKWLDETSASCNDHDTFAKGIATLAETCALEMNKLHKIAELLLVKQHHSTANEVDCIVQLCKQFNIHLHGLTNRFAAILSAREGEEAKTHLNTLFAELLVAMQHIEKAFKLFLPILQIGAV